MAVQESWLISKGAVKVCGGDYDVVYSLGRLFYVVDKDFHTVNEIHTHRDRPNYGYLLAMRINPHHLRCRQVLFQPPSIAHEKANWYCDTCGITLDLASPE